MTTLSKEANEATSAATSSTVSPANGQSQALSGQLHADAVSLEVPLKIHGSKVTEVVRGVTPHTAPFEEQTTSMIVFPHGGVLRMSTPVNAGQMLVLTNLKSRQDAICRVVKVRSYSNAASYVEVEFTHRQPGYWGVYFESDGASTSNETDSATPASVQNSSVANTVVPKETGSSVVPRQSKVSGITSASSQAGKQESSFISIGSQEEVQPPASSTSTAKAVRPIATAPSMATKPVQASTSQVSANVPKAEEQASSGGALIEDSQTDATVRELGQTSSEESFSRSGKSEKPSASNKNWMLMAACAAVLFVVVGGGILLFHHKSGDGASSAAAAPAAAPVVARQAAAQVSSTPLPAAQPETRATAAAVRQAPISVTPKASREVAEASVDDQTVQPEARVASKKPVPSVFGALNAHPVSTRRAATGPSAPNVDSALTASNESNPLLGITSMANGAALPPPGSKSAAPLAAPVAVAGRIKEPQLLSRVLPQYPELARQAHTEGSVVVEIVIDKSGNVSDAKATSGPAALRQAAVDAVKRWKYEAPLLDGQPTSIQRSVTIKFQL